LPASDRHQPIGGRGAVSVMSDRPPIGKSEPRRGHDHERQLLMKAANATVPRITPAQANEMIARNDNLGSFKEWAESGGAVEKPI
jgi:hypothetical protein